MMKKTRILVSLVITLFASEIRAQTGNITVSVSNLKNAKGKCFFCLYNKAEGFPAKMSAAVHCEPVAIKNNAAQFTFTKIPYGTYAVGAFHDENNDGKLNTNFLGIPKEGVGVSNNRIPAIGPPKFNEANFALTAGQDVNKSIQIKY